MFKHFSKIVFVALSLTVGCNWNVSSKVPFDAARIDAPYVVRYCEGVQVELETNVGVYANECDWVIARDTLLQVVAEEHPEILDQVTELFSEHEVWVVDSNRYPMSNVAESDLNRGVSGVTILDAWIFDESSAQLRIDHPELADNVIGSFQTAEMIMVLAHDFVKLVEQDIGYSLPYGTGDQVGHAAMKMFWLNQ